MRNRRVDRVLRDSGGRISYLLGAWGAVSAAQAISQVEADVYRYFIQWGNGELADLTVTGAPGAEELHTDTAGATENRLDSVPTMGRAD
ncbi:MAG TPA: hypothetical protein VGM94_14320 [Galbitalea sp.]|jgi:hypothetical protein